MAAYLFGLDISSGSTTYNAPGRAFADPHSLLGAYYVDFNYWAHSVRVW